MNDTDEDQEVVTATASYRRAIISATNYGRYFITVDNFSYPIKDLQDAKKKIDQLRDDQRN